MDFCGAHVTPPGLCHRFPGVEHPLPRPGSRPARPTSVLRRCGRYTSARGSPAASQLRQNSRPPAGLRQCHFSHLDANPDDGRSVLDFSRHTIGVRFWESSRCRDLGRPTINRPCRPSTPSAWPPSAALPRSSRNAWRCPANVAGMLHHLQRRLGRQRMRNMCVPPAGASWRLPDGALPAGRWTAACPPRP